MEVLALHQYIFTWLRIFPFAEGTNRKTNILSLIFSACVFLLNVMLLIASILYVYENGSLYQIMQISGLGCTVCNLSVAYITKNKIKNMFDKILEIYNGL